MLRKVLFSTLAAVFIVSLCLFVYNQTDAAVTCNASASANSLAAQERFERRQCPAAPSDDAYSDEQPPVKKSRPVGDGSP